MILLQIFWVFFKISLISLGGVFGVLPELERMIVVEYHWLSHDQFIQSYVMGQFVPGPNMAMCPMIGYWVAGWPGWLAGFFGIYTGPVIIMTISYTLYSRYRKLDGIRRTEIALRPIVFGLIASSAVHFWWRQTAPNRFLAIGLTVGGIYLYAKKILGPLQTVFALGFAWTAILTILELVKWS